MKAGELAKQLIDWGTNREVSVIWESGLGQTTAPIIAVDGSPFGNDVLLRIPADVDATLREAAKPDTSACVEQAEIEEMNA